MFMRHVMMIGPLAALCLAGCNIRPPARTVDDRSSLGSARQALAEGEAGTSLAIARGVLEAQPRNVAALVQAGNAEAALGDRIAADDSYKRALAISSSDVGARLGLAKLMIRDNLPGAEAALRQILTSAPRNAIVLTDLGYVLDLQERHAEAQMYYQQAIALDPTRISSRTDLALSLALSGHAEQAEQMFRDITANASATQKVRLDFAVAQVLAGHDKDAAVTLANELTPEEAQSALQGLEQLRPATKAN
jgi:Flp pilus assembly protein TadD